MLHRLLLLGSYKNPALKALLITDALLLTAEAMLVPIYAVFVVEIGGDILDAGITAAALAFGAGVASLVGGKYADGLRDKKQLIVACYALTALGFLLFTAVGSVWHLALVQASLGLVRAFAEPAFDALYSANLDKNREAQGWAAWEAMAYFVTAFGSVLGAAVVSKFSFDMLFVIMAIMAAVSATYLYSVPKSRLRQTV
jgi:MFS family permease